MDKKDISLQEDATGLTIRRPINYGTYGSAILERRVSVKGGLMSSTEAAIFLKISLRRLQQLTKEGKLKPLKKIRGKKCFNFYRFRELKNYQSAREVQKKNNGI